MPFLHAGPEDPAYGVDVHVQFTSRTARGRPSCATMTSAVTVEARPEGGVTPSDGSIATGTSIRTSVPLSIGGRPTASGTITNSFGGSSRTSRADSGVRVPAAPPDGWPGCPGSAGAVPTGRSAAGAPGTAAGDAGTPPRLQALRPRTRTST